MNVVKATVALDFAEAFKPWLELRAQIRAMRENQGAEIQGQPIQVDRAKQRRPIRVQVRGVRVDGKRFRSGAAAFAEVIGTLKELDEALPFPDSETIRFDVVGDRPLRVAVFTNSSLE